MNDKKKAFIFVFVLFLATALIIFSDKDGVIACAKSLSLKKCTFLGITTFEWLGIIATPLILTVGGYFANRFFKELEKERERQETLKNYFDQMISYLSNINWPREGADQKNQHGFNDQYQDADVKKTFAILRARTLAVLRELDGERKSSVIVFLIEAKVIPYMSLRDADLTGITIPKAQLEKVDLSNANLQGVNLSRANLELSNLSRANLKNANLIEAKLVGAMLYGACLEKSVLLKTDFRGASFSEIEQLERTENSAKNPLICNTRLPEYFLSEMERIPIKVSWHRDCSKIPSVLVDRRFCKNFVEANELVMELCQEKWLD
jgi:hypothetical protein